MTHASFGNHCTSPSSSTWISSKACVLPSGSRQDYVLPLQALKPMVGATSFLAHLEPRVGHSNSELFTRFFLGTAAAAFLAPCEAHLASQRYTLGVAGAVQVSRLYVSGVHQDSPREQQSNVRLPKLQMPLLSVAAGLIHQHLTQRFGACPSKKNSCGYDAAAD